MYANVVPISLDTQETGTVVRKTIIDKIEIRACPVSFKLIVTSANSEWKAETATLCVAFCCDFHALVSRSEENASPAMRVFYVICLTIWTFGFR